MSDLHALAREAGLQINWTDAAGQAQTTGDDSLRAVLDALGLPSDTAAALRHSRALLAEEAANPGLVTADAGTEIPLPPGIGDGVGELVLEDGATRRVTIAKGRLQGIDVTGYHRLRIGQRELRLAVAPARCFSVGDAAPGRKLWGPAVQVPALRDGRNAAFGDYSAVADAARAFAAQGADLMAISPVHALFPADPNRFSPYGPSSRLVLNTMFADPGLVGVAIPATEPVELIDWQTALPERLNALRAAYDAAGAGVADAVAAARTPVSDAHALYDAIHAHFAPAGGWADWPAAFQDAGSDAVARFAAEHEDEVAFYRFLQWLAARGLDAAQKAARDGGMAVGLIADLAVGMDAGGSHGWSRRDELLSGLSIGAPPDLLGPAGQDWGITSFDPRGLRRTGYVAFMETLRAALTHAGGIRIDHILGLARLWVVPDGLSPPQGAYLSQPLDDFLRLIALESQRACAIVIGEDLGTVPEGLRPKLEARAVMGMRVLWFEREEDALVPPEDYTPCSAAMTGTHDLPTVAGWWRGRDIDWNLKLGRGDPAPEAEQRARRDEERAMLWDGMAAAGAAEGPEPGPKEGATVADAALRFVGATASELAIIPMEDILALPEQPNLPGTIDEHPNWRRRLPDTTAALLARPDVVRRLDGLKKAREA